VIFLLPLTEVRLYCNVRVFLPRASLFPAYLCALGIVDLRRGAEGW
jgi:hypothetical protein